MNDILEKKIIQKGLTAETDQEATELDDLTDDLDQDDGAEKIDCVYKVVGSFGRWHLQFFSYYTIVYFISAFHNTGIVFYAARNHFWCKDLNSNLTDTEHEMILNKCVPGCKEYDYDRSMFHTTLVTEFNLVCDLAWFVSACKSVYELGYAFSSIIVGYSSDTYGRKITYKAMVLVEIMAGLGQALAPNIYVFLFSRFVLGISAYGRFLTGNLLITESCGPQKRAFLSIFIENGWYCGQVLLLVSFYFVSNFRYIQLMITTFEICSIFYFSLVPESIRWLLTKSRYDEAREMLQNAASMKKKKCTQKELDRKIDSLIEHFKLKNLEAKQKQKDKGFLLFKLWGIPGMFKLCLCFYIFWFSRSLISLSATFNSTDFGNNLYINIGLFNVASFMANSILNLIVERFKRVHLAKISFFLMFLTVFGITISFYQDEYSSNLMPFSNQPQKNSVNTSMQDYGQLKQNAREHNFDFELLINEGAKTIKSTNNFRLWCGVFLKYCTAICYHMIFILCVECFPTIIRQFSIGTCSVTARFASVVAPFTRELSNVYGYTLTYAIFSCLSFFSFLLFFFVPETKDREIPNSLEDCVRMNEEKKNRKNQASKTGCKA